MLAPASTALASQSAARSEWCCFTRNLLLGAATHRPRVGTTGRRRVSNVSARFKRVSHCHALPAPPASARRPPYFCPRALTRETAGHTAGSPECCRGSLSLFTTAVRLFTATAQPLALLALLTSLAERVLTNGAYALCAALGVPVASPTTLICGCAGIAAGFLVHAYAKGASFVLLHTSATAGPPDARAQQRWTHWLNTVRNQAPGPLTVIWADVKRLAAVAWAYALTFPLPLFALPRAVDLALAVPVVVFDQTHRRQPLLRSTALTQRRKLRVVHAVAFLFTFLGVLATLAGVVTLAIAPGLPDVLMAGRASSAPGDVAAHFFSGAAFAGVFAQGTLAEQGALTCGLLAVALLRWVTSGLLNALLTVLWLDFNLAGPLPPREPHPLVKRAHERWSGLQKRFVERLRSSKSSTK